MNLMKRIFLPMLFVLLSANAAYGAAASDSLSTEIPHFELPDFELPNVEVSASNRKEVILNAIEAFRAGVGKAVQALEQGGVRSENVKKILKGLSRVSTHMLREESIEFRVNNKNYIRGILRNVFIKNIESIIKEFGEDCRFTVFRDVRDVKVLVCELFAVGVHPYIGIPDIGIPGVYEYFVKLLSNALEMDERLVAPFFSSDYITFITSEFRYTNVIVPRMIRVVGHGGAACDPVGVVDVDDGAGGRVVEEDSVSPQGSDYNGEEGLFDDIFRAPPGYSRR